MFSNKPSTQGSNSLLLNHLGQHQHLYLTPIRSPASINSATASSNHQLAWTSRFNGITLTTDGPQLSSSNHNHCNGGSSASSSTTLFNGGSNHVTSNPNNVGVIGTRPPALVNNTYHNVEDDRCEHQAAGVYHRTLCEHCGEKFCDSCEIRHKEKIKNDILKMAQSFLSQDYNFDQQGLESRALNVRDYLSKYVETVRRNVESELASTELKFANAANIFINKLRCDADQIIQRACDLRDAEIVDLITIGSEAVRCHAERERIVQLVDRLHREQVFFITLHDMYLLHSEIVRCFGMSCAIDALRNAPGFYSDKVLEFNRHPGFVPMLDRCLDFFHTVQLGSVKFTSPIKKIRELLSGKTNFDTSPFKPLFTPSNTATNDNQRAVDYIGKSFYDRMHFLGIVAGKDADGWEIRKPFGLVWLTNTEYLAVVHRPKRITLITINREVIATYKFADPDCNQSGGLNFHGNLAADDEWKIYFIDEPGLRIFSFDVKANPLKEPNGELTTPRVFTRLYSSGGSRSAISLSQFSNENNSDAPQCNKMKFHGLAVGLGRRELYTEAGDSIVGFSLADGTPRFRCLLEPAHQFSSHVLGVIDRPSSISYLIYSTSHGNVLHKKAFLSNGLLEEGSSIIANQGSEMNCVSEVRGVANDPSGNLLLADSKNGCIKVFSENFQVFSSFGYGNQSSFNPSAVAVAYVANSQPVVVVTEFSSHSIIFFSAN